MDYQDPGLVHNMLDKFENATLLIRLGLPSTLQHTNTRKEISQLFCISVDGELFVSGTFWMRLHHFVMWFNFSSLSWSLIWHGRQHDVFCVVDNNFFFNRLFRVKYCFSSHEYCTPENQEWLTTIIVLSHSSNYYWCQRIQGKRRDVTGTTTWWDNFVNEVVVPED